jgi:hypothetical protein
LVAKAASTVTKIDNITYRGNTKTCPFKLFYCIKPIGIKYLHIFGEVGVVADRTKLKAKLDP